MVVAGVTWTFWIAVLITIIVFVSLALLAIGYLAKVVSPKYPPGEMRRRIDAFMSRR